MNKGHELVGKDVLAIIARNDGAEIVFGTVTQVVFQKLLGLGTVETVWRVSGRNSKRTYEASSIRDTVIDVADGVEPQILMREVMARLPLKAVKKEGGE